MVRLTNDGSVVYRVRQDRCRGFSEPANVDLKKGPRCNFQVFSALDFLAEVTQHIPNKAEHLVRYYGWYSHRQRGMRAKVGSEPKKIPVDRAAIYVDESTDRFPHKGSVSTRARLIKRVYEVDPLECPDSGGAMKIISFTARRQPDVMQRVLRHCGL